MVNTNKYLPQPQILHGSDATHKQPVISSGPYPLKIYSGRKIGTKPTSPLQNVLASLVDLNSRSYIAFWATH